jgi:hypothetical protein
MFLSVIVKECTLAYYGLKENIQITKKIEIQRTTIFITPNQELRVVGLTRTENL